MIRLQVKYVAGLCMAAAAPVEVKKNKSKEKIESLMIKPSNLPLYEDPQELYEYEYQGKETSKLEEGISVVRKELESAYEATKETRDAAVNIYETGKAHSLATIDYVLDEENIAAKAGVITFGGLLGLIIGGRRKGFIKKIFYTALGATGGAAAVYPKEAVKISEELYENAGDYSAIAYNFIAGVKPQNDHVSVPATDTSNKASSSISSPPQEKPGGTPQEKSNAKDVIVKLAKTATDSGSPPAIKGDIGQSNPEDKDMYTTRS